MQTVSRAGSRDLAAERASYAFQRARKWREPRETAQLVKGLPVAVRSLGLAQAVAMLTRRSRQGRQLADDLCGWLLDRAPMKTLGESDRSDAVGLVERVVGASPQAARAAEEEAVRFLEALKLFGDLIHGSD